MGIDRKPGKLVEAYPEIVKTFHSSLNSHLSLSELSTGSDIFAWWTCDQGHEYQLRVKDRVTSKRCPVCSNRRIVSGVNDLQTRFPNLALQWSKTKNKETDPSKVSASSHTANWWVCDLGHEWKVSASSRVFFDSGCPFCSNKKVMPGFNDLATTHSQLAKEWNFDRNTNVDPTDVIAGTSKKIWWKCSLGHEWQAACSSRAFGNAAGCPVCSNRQVLSGHNDLTSTHPSLSAQWHPTKNELTLPSSVSAGAHKGFWWLCESGHEWKASPSNRTTKASGCPMCAGQKVVTGVNDLATTHPDLAGQWHPSKNGNLDPNSIMAGTGKYIWWLCESGHEWKAPGFNRMKGVGCPTCATTGFDPNLPGYFYLIENQTLRSRKVGIANSHSDRLASWTKSGWLVLHVIEDSSGNYILDLETRVLRWIRRDLQLPAFLSKSDIGKLAGWSETFSAEDHEQEFVIEGIKAIAHDLGKNRN